MSVPSMLFLNRYVKGWPEPSDPAERAKWFDDKRAALVDVADALTRRFDDDAHFAPYAANVERRHAIRLLQSPEHADKIASIGLRMTLAVFDVDGPDHNCSPEWMSAECDKLHELLKDHPGGFVYMTRGGYRVVFRLADPFPIRCQRDDDRWTARYASWCRYLRRRFQIEADETCSDWTRIFRAPFVVRDGVAQSPDTFGDPANLGTWAAKLTRADIVRPKATKPTHGAVAPVPIDDPDSPYGQARIASAVEYLERAPLSIEGQRGRDTFFSVCCYLVRRLRLPIDIAADCVDAVYNERLRTVGTTTWSRDDIENRLASARDTSSAVPPGHVATEETWTDLQTIRKSA